MFVVSKLLSPGFLSGIQRAAQTVLGVYLKRTCSRDTSAPSALGVLDDCVLYKSTHSIIHSLQNENGKCLEGSVWGGMANTPATFSPRSPPQSSVNRSDTLHLARASERFFFFFFFFPGDH